MTDPRLAAVVLAAGKGTRMLSERPKVLHPIANRPMVAHVLQALSSLLPGRIVVVVGPGMEAVTEAVAPHPTVVQAEQLGTGQAVLVARQALGDFAAEGKDLLIAFGDTPLVTARTFQAMLAARRSPQGQDPAPALVLLGFRPASPAGYGRIVLDVDGRPERIVEERDAGEAERSIDLCNGGLMLVDGGLLFRLLARIGNDNAKGEYYLTDLAALVRAEGLPAAVVEAPEGEVMGINSRAELAVAEALLQARLRGKALAEGVTLIDPSTVWLSADTILGRDVTIHPNVFFGPGVHVADGAEILSFCHLVGAEIGPGAQVGPFARLRPDTVIGRDARIGNFVEIKNAVIDRGAKVNHLSYVGDASVGAKANVGAGTITCNYDGFAKHRTTIGAGVFIGSNTALVAPVTVGEGALIGAGSTITEDVPADAIAVARGPQETREGAAKRYREKQQAAKAAKSPNAAKDAKAKRPAKGRQGEKARARTGGD
ncbi:MAG: bifunctional UDP-N-acetylglucosamine diphosphorylase/glucosamine-1-phosphate N-acetyltransferase GlmU [Kiloniellales bacterium]